MEYLIMTVMLVQILLIIVGVKQIKDGYNKAGVFNIVLNFTFFLINCHILSRIL